MDSLASGARALVLHRGVQVEGADVCNLLEVQVMTLAQARAIIKANQGEQREFESFCGFEDGQDEADLSGKELQPGHAVLLAWDLTKGHVSVSMNSLT